MAVAGFQGGGAGGNADVCEGFVDAEAEAGDFIGGIWEREGRSKGELFGAGCHGGGG